MFAFTVQTSNAPYGTATKQQPSRSDFSKIIPIKVGAFNRIN